jgi:hypothetical protein
MSIKLWERLRGYDRWIQTEATVESSNVEEIIDGFDPRSETTTSTRHGYEELVWNDGSGIVWKREVDVGEDSPLFQLYDGKSVTIRLNPTSPGECYVRELLRDHVNLVAKIAFWGVAGIALIFALSAVLRSEMILPGELNAKERRTGACSKAAFPRGLKPHHFCRLFRHD